MTFLDYSYNPAETGEVVGDWYNHDADHDPGDIGIDENPVASGYNSLDVGVAIEPQ